MIIVSSIYKLFIDKYKLRYYTLTNTSQLKNLYFSNVGLNPLYSICFLNHITHYKFKWNLKSTIIVQQYFEINIYFLVTLKCFVCIINDLLIEFKTSFWPIANLVMIALNAPVQNMCSTTIHHIYSSFKTSSNSSSNW